MGYGRYLSFLFVLYSLLLLMPALSIIRQISDYPAAIALSLREIQDTLDYLQGQSGDVSYGDVVARVIRDLKVCLLYEIFTSF